MKNIPHVDVSNFTFNTNLASLKTEVDKLDVDKLKPVPGDLAKLSNVVENDVVKKTEYNKLVCKVDNIDTKKFLSRTKYEVEGKIPSITGLATNSALTAIENKIPDISSLVKKTDYNTKISDIEKQITDHSPDEYIIEKKITNHTHDEYITTPEFNRLTTKF